MEAEWKASTIDTYSYLIVVSLGKEARATIDWKLLKLDVKILLF